ncbi:MAG: orotidine-5'-phosphate decarboxylase [Marinilabiliales bacterium]
MNYQNIVNQIKQKKSFLCIGLDTDIDKIPKHLLDSQDPAFEFNKKIIDATHDIVIAYKPNVAFYESSGIDGWKSLIKTAEYIKNNFPDILLIADAKRGDIGNTSKMYAKAFLENLPFDAITVAPYMGSDSVQPFLEIKNKWTIILSLTSNNGAFDFQLFENKSGVKLFEQVIKTSKDWGTINNIMYVVGATKAEMLTEIRKIIPEHFLLIPGIGAQGGSLEDVVKFGINKNCGLIVNSSRGIIYASDNTDFDTKAREKALETQLQMKDLLEKHNII